LSVATSTSRALELSGSHWRFRCSAVRPVIHDRGLGRERGDIKTNYNLDSTVIRLQEASASAWGCCTAPCARTWLFQHSAYSLASAPWTGLRARTRLPSSETHVAGLLHTAKLLLDLPKLFLQARVWTMAGGCSGVVTPPRTPRTPLTPRSPRTPHSLGFSPRKRVRTPLCEREIRLSATKTGAKKIGSLSQSSRKLETPTPRHQVLCAGTCVWPADETPEVGHYYVGTGGEPTPFGESGYSSSFGPGDRDTAAGRFRHLTSIPTPSLL